MPGLSGITQVSVQGDHVLALDSSGTVWSWGRNTFGELGDRTTGGSHPTPVPVPFLNQIVQVSAGVGYSLALRSDGTVWAFGGGGVLGDGTTVSRDSPEQVPGLGGITKVVAGDGISYAIGAGGALLAWGSNANGGLGNGTTTGQSLTPVAVPGLTGVTSVATSDSETLAAVGPAGTMWSWGTNAFGANGNGTTTPNYTPQPTSLSGVIQVAASDRNGAAVLASGTLMTWGLNYGGQLGNGGKDAFYPPAHPTPGPVRTLAGVTQVALSDGLRAGHRLARAARAQRDRRHPVRGRPDPAGGRVRARPGRRRRRHHLRVPRRGQDPELRPPARSTRSERLSPSRSGRPAASASSRSASGRDHRSGMT